MTNRRLLDPVRLTTRSAPDGATVFAVDPLDNAVDHPHEEQREELRAVDMADAFLDATVPPEVTGPTILTVLPSSGIPALTTVMIGGTGFVTGSAVLVDGTAVTTQRLSDTSLRVNLNLPVGDHIFMVRTPDGLESNETIWSVTAPTLTSLSPDTCSIAAGVFSIVCLGEKIGVNDYLYIGTKYYTMTSGTVGMCQGEVDPAALTVGTFDAYISTEGLRTNTLPFTVTA